MTPENVIRRQRHADPVVIEADDHYDGGNIHNDDDGRATGPRGQNPLSMARLRPKCAQSCCEIASGRWQQNRCTPEYMLGILAIPPCDEIHGVIPVLKKPTMQILFGAICLHSPKFDRGIRAGSPEYYFPKLFRTPSQRLRMSAATSSATGC